MTFCLLLGVDYCQPLSITAGEDKKYIRVYNSVIPIKQK